MSELNAEIRAKLLDLDPDRVLSIISKQGWSIRNFPGCNVIAAIPFSNYDFSLAFSDTWYPVGRRYLSLRNWKKRLSVIVTEEAFGRLMSSYQEGEGK